MGGDILRPCFNILDVQRNNWKINSRKLIVGKGAPRSHNVKTTNKGKDEETVKNVNEKI